MKLKSTKTGLEGKVKNQKFWNKIIEEGADAKGNIHYCRLKYKACNDWERKNCVYQEIYKIVGDEE